MIRREFLSLLASVTTFIPFRQWAKQRPKVEKLGNLILSYSFDRTETLDIYSRIVVTTTGRTVLSRGFFAIHPDFLAKFSEEVRLGMFGNPLFQLAGFRCKEINFSLDVSGTTIEWNSVHKEV